MGFRRELRNLLGYIPRVALQLENQESRRVRQVKLLRERLARLEQAITRVGRDTDYAFDQHTRSVELADSLCKETVAELRQRIETIHQHHAEHLESEWANYEEEQDARDAEHERLHDERDRIYNDIKFLTA